MKYRIKITNMTYEAEITPITGDSQPPKSVIEQVTEEIVSQEQEPVKEPIEVDSIPILEYDFTKADSVVSNIVKDYSPRTFNGTLWGGRKFTDSGVPFLRFVADKEDFINTNQTSKELMMMNSAYSIVMKVKFTDLSSNQRVVASRTKSAKAGSSLQVGVLKGGLPWIDTFMGGLSNGIIEENEWVTLAFTFDPFVDDIIYLNGSQIATGNIPTLKEDTEICIARWMNTFADFDLQKLIIYPNKLTKEEVNRLML